MLIFVFFENFAQKLFAKNEEEKHEIIKKYHFLRQPKLQYHGIKKGKYAYVINFLKQKTILYKIELLAKFQITKCFRPTSTALAT